MGVVENIAHDRFPKQGQNHFLRAKVAFHFDISHQFDGVILRDDAEDPYVLVIALTDGRVVLGTECQYQPIPDDPNDCPCPCADGVPSEKCSPRGCDPEPAS
jgi:hypothetical protein